MDGAPKRATVILDFGPKRRWSSLCTLNAISLELVPPSLSLVSLRFSLALFLSRLTSTKPAGQNRARGTLVHLQHRRRLPSPTRRTALGILSYTKACTVVLTLRTVQYTHLSLLGCALSSSP